MKIWNNVFLMAEEGTGGGSGGSPTLFTQQQGSQQGSQQQQQQEGSQQGGGQQQQQQGSQQQQQGAAFSWGSSIDETGSFKPGWTDSLPDNLKGAKETLARYKSPEALILGLQSANQLLGAKSSAVIVPGDNAKPEVVAEFRKALGVPEKPEGYGIKRPDNLPAEITWDDARFGKFAEVLHKHNATPALVRELVAMQAQEEINRASSESQSAQQFINDGLNKLRAEWGNNFDKNLAAGSAILQHYAERTGLNAQHPALMHPEVAKFLAAIHEDFMTEHVRIDGRGIVSGDPATTAKDIMTNPQNPLYQKYRDGDATTVSHVRGLLQQGEKAKEVRGT